MATPINKNLSSPSTRPSLPDAEREPPQMASMGQPSDELARQIQPPPNILATHRNEIIQEELAAAAVQSAAKRGVLLPNASERQMAQSLAPHPSRLRAALNIIATASERSRPLSKIFRNATGIARRSLDPQPSSKVHGRLIAICNILGEVTATLPMR